MPSIPRKVIWRSFIQTHDDVNAKEIEGRDWRATANCLAISPDARFIAYEAEELIAESPTKDKKGQKRLVIRSTDAPESPFDTKETIRQNISFERIKFSSHSNLLVCFDSNSHLAV